jgi:hypothetical protein
VFGLAAGGFAGKMRPSRHVGKAEDFEPPRVFEALLRGRGYAEAPDVTTLSAASAW